MPEFKNKTSATIERTCCIEMKLKSWVVHAYLLFQRLERTIVPLATDREACSRHWRCAMKALTTVGAIVGYKWSCPYLVKHEWGKRKKRGALSLFMPSSFILGTRYSIANPASYNSIYYRLSVILSIGINTTWYTLVLCYIALIIKLFYNGL